MTNQSDTEKKSLSRQQFDLIATVLGFIVDLKELITTLLGLLGVVSLLLAKGNAGQPATFVLTSINITPFHAFGLWLIALYTYLGFARNEWNRNKVTKDYHDTFRSFIFRDLLFGWKSIPYSVAAIAFLLLFAWNFVEMVIFWSPLFYILFFVGILLFFGLIGWMSLKLGDLFDLSPGYEYKKKAQTFLKELENDWPKWDKIVQQRIAGYQFISAGAFCDIMELYEIGTRQIQTLLARYSSNHSETTFYGTVFKKEDKQPVTTDNVLINIKSLDREKYYI